MPDKRKTPGSSMSSPQYAKRARPLYDDEGTGNGRASAVTPHERPRNHPVYGQKSAFPGLDSVEGDDELFYGPADDGMEYLRMVRSEANSLPFLFTATKSTTPQTTQPTEQDIPEETQQIDKEEMAKEVIKVAPEGVYVDGVYVGPRNATAAQEDDLDSAYSDAQATYYNLLHHRFLLLRSILKCTPPSAAIAVLDDSHPITFPRHSKNARKEWRRLLLAVDPQTVQLACMDMDSVLGVLGIMARLMSENVRSGDAERVRRIGAWAWGLLGKCRDIGQLGTEEVGEIRDLGKRAVKILHKMKEEEVSKSRSADQHQEQDEEASGDESDDEPEPEPEPGPELEPQGNGEETVGKQDEDGTTVQAVKGADLDVSDAVKDPALEDEELAQAKARLQATLQDETASQPPSDEAETKTTETSTESDAVEVAAQTRAMLDMIITVVGEYFGQRDLLPTRELWEVSIAA